MSTPHFTVVRHYDYFSFTPSSHTVHYDHLSTESACSSPVVSPAEVIPIPQHPLLARRGSISYTMPVSSLLQIQAAAAHDNSPKRPQLQDVLHVTSDESTSSDSSKSSMDSLHCSPEFARCSRCHRTSSLDRDGKSNMISWSINSYYCRRCAEVVGLPNR